MGPTFSPSKVEFTSQIGIIELDVTSSDGVLQSVDMEEGNPTINITDGTHTIAMEYGNDYTIGDIELNFTTGLGKINFTEVYEGDPIPAILHITSINYNGVTYYPE